MCLQTLNIQFLIFQRIFYAGLGTTGMGYICFPEETKEIMKDNSGLIKQYINIAYNFFYGGNTLFYDF